MRVLREFHGAVGPLIISFEATLEHFAGDGLMVLFNDPLPCPDPAVRAVLIRSTGKIFCAGGDLASFKDAGDAVPALLKEMTTYLHAALSRLA